MGWFLAITISPDSFCWVVCAIWINGSELLDLACFVSNLTYPADEKERSLEDSDGERSNGCTFNNAFCRTNSGI